MRIKINFSSAHLAPYLWPVHGPQDWPWWRLLSFRLTRLDQVQRPSTGHRLWLYSRWGALYWEVFFDRRPRCPDGSLCAPGSWRMRELGMGKFRCCKRCGRVTDLI